MLIDHLVYAAPGLAAAVADVEERLGVRARAGGRHIGLGTHNALLALGPRTYLAAAAALIARLSGPNGSAVLW